MTINAENNAQMKQVEYQASLNQQGSVQNTLQKDVLKEAVNGNSSSPKQMIQLLAATQPLAQIQSTAKNQISKGFLDIKI
jgi:hypothetical protein